MLECRYHQHARIAGEDFLGAVAMMHIEINDSHALKAVMLQCMRGRYSHVVEQTKSHRTATLCVMAGRPHTAKCSLCFATDYHVSGEHGSAGSMQCSIQRVRTHCSVGIEMHDAIVRSGLLDRIDITCFMHAFELFACGFGRIGALQMVDQTRSDQLIFDCRQARRLLWMMRTHVMQRASAVSDKCGAQI